MSIEAGQDRPFPDFPANERVCDFQRINVVVSASTFMLFDPVMLLVGFRKIREYRCHGASVEVGGQFVCISSVPSTYGYWGSNSGHWAWWQVALPTESSGQFTSLSLMVRCEVLCS